MRSVTRIMIVVEIRLYREGLADILNRQPLLEVVGCADSSASALDQVLVLAPDIILMDQALPESSLAIREILALRPGLKLIRLAVTEEEAEIIACAEAGIAGYVRREASVTELLQAVDSVVRGEVLCPPKIAAGLFRRLAWRAVRAEPEPKTQVPLTLRELEVVRLIDQGLGNKEIATRLGIEVATVKNHVHNLLEKLRVHRRGEAAARLRNLAPSCAPSRTPAR